MGAFSKQADITIENQPGWDAGEYIKVKGVMNVGDMQATASANADGTLKAGISTLLSRMITDWTLLADGNQQVPLWVTQGQATVKNMRAIEQLPTQYAQPVLDAIDKLAVQQNAQVDQQDFMPTASAPTGGN